MKILYLAGSGQHSHDYGNAYLFDGLVEVLGYDSVIDWPVNPTFHLLDASERDECALDSDLFYGPRTYTEWNFDLIVLATCDSFAFTACNGHKSVPVVAVDYSDQVADRRAEYEACASRRITAYFKRELPAAGENCYPLPMCYPASRVPRQSPDKAHTVVYHATNHAASGPGLPRMQIVNQLRNLLHADQLDMGLYVGQEKGTRPTPEELHERMARSLISFSWNGWPHVVQWDCNRFWENFAFGLAQVAEMPRIQIPNAPVDEKHCLYATTPEEVVDMVWLLSRDEKWAHELAAAGHAHFMQHHTSAARARYLLDIVSKVA